LLDLLDQTGQGAARLVDEDQSGQVILAVSDRAHALAGAGAGHELRAEAAAIVVAPDLGAGFERVFGLHGAAEQEDGDSGAGEEACGHGRDTSWADRQGRRDTNPAVGS
jgi:hypothetical protein